jgi:hypothetical protein
MKIEGVKKFFVVIIILGGLMATMSSCNRGIGCPSDFSLEQIAKPLVKSVIYLH